MGMLWNILDFYLLVEISILNGGNSRIVDYTILKYFEF